MRPKVLILLGLIPLPLALPAVVQAAPCGDPYSASGRFRLSVPPELTYERSSRATLVSYVGRGRPPGEEYVSARLDYLSDHGGRVATRILSARELQSINDAGSIEQRGSYPVLMFPVRYMAPNRTLVLRFGAALVRPGEPPCEVSVRRQVRFTAGLRPRPILKGYDRRLADDPFEPAWTISLELGTRCERLTTGELRVTITHHGRRRVLTPRKRCTGLYYGTWSWRRDGGIMPGLRAESGFGALVLFPVGRRPRARTYRVDVVWNRRRLLRAWVRTTIGRRHAPRRAYALRDTRLFNLCFEERLVRVDADGRRYCDVPGWTEHKVQLLCKPPQRGHPRTFETYPRPCVHRSQRSPRSS